MKDLRLQLGDTDFERLVELGRSIIPTVAPEWTDHNIHDPGIMLVELMAWIADAQIYSLARTRRDERQAYARLLGVKPRGPTPARGLIWPLVGSISDPRPAPQWAAGAIVKPEHVIMADYPNAPPFRTTHAIQLTTARLVRLSDGATRDWTGANTQEGATFMPFGQKPAKGDRLVLQFQGGPLIAGTPNVDSLIAIGVEIAATELVVGETINANSHDRCSEGRLRASLIDSAGERRLEIEEDTTGGLLKSGVLLAGPGATLTDENFSISICSASGEFLRPPRVQRIAINVLPVTQIKSVPEEDGSFGTGMPHQIYRLKRQRLIFPMDQGAFRVQLYEQGHWADWSIATDLQTCNPNDKKFTIDCAAGILYFGNGVNGQKPSAEAALQLNYQVSDGIRGNLPKNLSWTVQGVAGVFGKNSEAISGGLNGHGLAELRQISRQRSRQARPLVTTDDLVSAALAFSDLGVKRALEVIPSSLRGHHVRGTRILVAVGPHDTDAAATSAMESADWLAEIRARLAPRLPLGQRLEVIASRYVNVRITARLVAAPNVDPADVEQKAAETLHTRLAIVAQHDGDSEWPFGRDITLLSVKAWLRNVEGVVQVIEVRLRKDGHLEQAIRLGAIGLPQLNLDPGDIVVERSPRGTMR